MREFSGAIRSKGCYRLSAISERKGLNCRKIVDIGELNVVSRNLC